MIFYFIQIASACNLLTKRIDLYPTINEQLSVPLQYLFNSYNFKYSCELECPENVTITNICTLIQSQQINMSSSITFNSTHIAAFNNNSQKPIYLYQYDEINNNISFLTSAKIINQSPIHCNNMLFTYQGMLLIDCFALNEQSLYFYYLDQSSMEILQIIEIQEILTPQTPYSKMLNFQQEQETYLLYALRYQREDKYILTLLKFEKDQYVNLTTWSYGVYDFDVSNKFIYIIGGNQETIYQVQVSNQQFVILFNYTDNTMTKFSQIKTKSSYFSASQCDFLSVNVDTQAHSLSIIFLQAWNGSIIFFNQKFYNNFGSTATTMFGEQFFGVYEVNYLSLMEIGIPQFGKNFEVIIRGFSGPQLYLDKLTNKLFWYYLDKIKIYKLQIPQINIYKNQITQTKLRIIGEQIYGFNVVLSKIQMTCFLDVYITVIDKNDTNIYVNFNDSNMFYNSILPNSFDYRFNNFAGPFLSTTGIIENSLIGNFKEITFQPLLFELNQQFSCTCMFEIPNTLQNDYSQYLLFFAGATAEGIYFYICGENIKCNQIYYDSNIKYITQIQISYNFQGFYLVGVNQGQFNITIYSVNMYLTDNFVQKQVLSFPNYKQYILMYDKIILLLQNNQILIQSLISFDNVYITGQLLNKIFSNQSQQEFQFEFTPINLEMNQADQSSILFINNNNSFIIVSILNINIIIPLSIIKVNYQIYQLNIIDYQLIISHQCDQQICFEVWNVENLQNPYYQKSLPNIQRNKYYSIQSDNLFFYVLQKNQTVLVLNPLLSYHSSLYYEFQIEYSQFSSISIGTYSIISCSSQIFKMSAMILQQFQYNENYNISNYITQSYFNFTVNNKDSKQIVTNNNILSLISPYTQMNINDIEINKTFEQHQTIIINLQDNEQLKYLAQIQNYSIYRQQHGDCNLQNYIQSAKINSIPSLSNWSQVMIFNQTLILQNGLEYTFLNIKIKGNNMTIIDSNQLFSNSFNLSSYITQPYCNTTFIYNETIVTQMCILSTNNTQNWYVIQFEYNCQNFQNCNIYNYNIYEMKTNNGQIQQIIKQISINQQYQIILGVYEGWYSQLYLITIDQDEYKVENLEIPCSAVIVDFALFQVENYIGIFYICENKLYFKQLSLDEEGYFQLNQLDPVLLFDTVRYLQSGQSQLNHINILSTNNMALLLILTTNNALSFVVFAGVVVQFGIQLEFTTFHILKTLPPYGNSLQQIWSQNNFFFIEYQIYEDRYVYAVYNWTSINDTITKPLLMNGGFEQVGILNSIAFNLTQTGGYIYQINDGQLFAYVISQNSSLYCTLNSKKDQQLIMIASNYKENCQFTVNLQYDPQKQWLLGLLLFLAIVFLIAIFFYWYKTKDIIEKESFLEEIELNE